MTEHFDEILRDSVPATEAHRLGGRKRDITKTMK